MALTPGTRLGPYEVLGPLGAGGMGEVYRGIDTRLDRPVAIKHSHERFTERFHGEARAISALNHPNVCTLYDVGPDYLVMELVEGDTLAARLQRGACPTELVLRYGAQIADALAAAHARGITHRDLKPSNIMITKTGVKVLDFGLAKFSGSLAETAEMTQGVVGTPAYMAPEQLTGSPVDARTDIFALGLVLYEMATGRRVLAGHGQPPDLSGIPTVLAHVIDRCLAQDPDDRWQSAGDVRRELEWAGRQSEPVTAADAQAAEAGPGAHRRRAGLAAGLLALLAAGAGAGTSRLLSTAAPAPSGVPTRTTIGLPAGFRLESSSPLALSPDGTSLAFVAVDERGGRQLYVRPLASIDARALPGTTGAMHPFFSPDGQSIGFFADNTLQRVGVGGSAPLRIAAMPGVDHGGTWGANDVIVVAVRGRGMFKVNAAGGSLEPIAQELRGAWPSFLPDGITILYTSFEPDGGRTTGLAVISIDGSGQRDIARLSDVNGAGAPVLGTATEIAQAILLPSGYLVYAQDPGFVRALPTDPESLTPKGTAVTLADPVERAANNGGIAFAVSSNGLLVFAGTGNDHQLVWVSRQGTISPLPAEKAAYRHPRLAPDEKTIAVSANDDTRSPHLWTLDVERGTRMRVASNSMMPAWTPDGRRVAHNGGGARVVLMPVNGGTPEVLVTPEQARAQLPLATAPYPTGWSPDGRYLLLQADNQDVWRLSPEKTLEPVLVGPTSDWGAVVSSDGRAVAYVSNVSGRQEVYIARWPSLEQKTVVSTDGGVLPRWSRSSRELFFWQGETLMAARVDTSLQTSVPQALFSGAFFGTGRDRGFDVASDGRFLMVKSDERAELRQVTVVQNWVSTLSTGSIVGR